MGVFKNILKGSASAWALSTFVKKSGDTMTGNLGFSGNGRKITGDFSNTTRANRLALQTSTTNGNTRVPIIPNGTATLSGIDCFSSSDPDNSSYLQVHADDGVHVGLNSSKSGTGVIRDLAFQIDGVTKAKINAIDGKLNVDTLTASKVVATNSSKDLISLDYDSSAAASSLARRDSNSNLFCNAISQKLTATVGAGQTIALDFSSSPIQVHNIGGNITYTLPTLTGLAADTSFTYIIYNNTTANVTTINSSGGNSVASLVSGQYTIITNILTSGTTAASWLATTSSALAVASSVAKRDSSGGLAAAYFGTFGNVATAGSYRMQASESVAWRNQANSANILLSKDSSDNLTWNSSILITQGNAATQAQQEAGSSTSVFVSPGRQQFHPSSVKTFCAFNYVAGVPTITRSYNVTSITDTGTGDALVNLTTAFSNGNQCCGGGTDDFGVYYSYTNMNSASSIRFRTLNSSRANVDSNSTCNVWAFGQQ